MGGGKKVRQFVPWSLQIPKGKPQVSRNSNLLAEPKRAGASALRWMLATWSRGFLLNTLSSPFPMCMPRRKGATFLLLFCLPPPEPCAELSPSRNHTTLFSEFSVPSPTGRPPLVSVPALSTHPRPQETSKHWLGSQVLGFSSPHPLTCEERKSREEKNGRRGTCGRKRVGQTTMYFWVLTHMQVWLLATPN